MNYSVHFRKTTISLEDQLKQYISPVYRDTVKQPHIKLETADEYCLVSGNPDRVPVIASFLKDGTQVNSHRGLVAYKGYTPQEGAPVTVLTTGMGGPTTAIVIEEAYRAGARKFIRIGSCGSLVTGETHQIGNLYLPYGAIRAEGVSEQLVPMEVPAVASYSLYNQMRQSADELGLFVNDGYVVSSDIYYNDHQFQHWVEYGATCVEMESGVIFSYSNLKPGFQAATILTTDGNLVEHNDIYKGDTENRLKVFNEGVENSIKLTLHAIDMLEK